MLNRVLPYYTPRGISLSIEEKNRRRIKIASGWHSKGCQRVKAKKLTREKNFSPKSQKKNTTRLDSYCNPSELIDILSQRNVFGILLNQTEI